MTQMPDLGLAREAVLQAVASAPADARHPSVTAAVPLTDLSSLTASKYRRLSLLGLLGSTRSFARRRLLALGAQVVTGGLGVGLIVLSFSPNMGPWAVPGLFFIFAGLLRWYLLRRDSVTNDLILDRDEMQELNAARTWTSPHPWESMTGAGEQYRLVLAAMRAVQRIAATEAWGQARLRKLSEQLDLHRELDTIDADAFAAARAVTPRDTPQWTHALDLVVALTACADEIERYAGEQAALADGPPLTGDEIHAYEARRSASLDRLSVLVLELANRPRHGRP
jgi:hypothetical protein